MARAIPLADMCWHFFGACRFPKNATPILNLDNDEAASSMISLWTAEGG